MVRYVLIFVSLLIQNCMFVEIPILGNPLEQIQDKVIEPFRALGNVFEKAVDENEEKKDNLTQSITEQISLATKDTFSNETDEINDYSTKNDGSNSERNSRNIISNLPLIGHVADKINNTLHKVADHVVGFTKINETIINFISNALITYENHQIEVPFLKETIEKLKIPAKLFRTKIVNPIAKEGICIVSAATFKYFITRSRLNLSSDRLVSVLVYLCKLLNIESEATCRGVIELNIDTLIYIVKNNQDLNAFKMSSTIFQNYGCFKSHRRKWSVTLPDGESRERITKSSDYFYRILQITDLHMDPLYKVGVTTKCDQPLCCQNDQKLATNPEHGAGKWGAYNSCDMPYEALHNLLDQVLEHNSNLTPSFSYIYFTGDIISHRVWDTSKDMNTREIKRVYGLFREKFANIQLYPILGNHEPHPLDLFAPLSITDEKFSTTWLFDLIAEEWSGWLPNSALDTIRQGGYYTVLVKPGFRIVALNSNVCYTFNWWLLFDEVDPFGQLQWLIGVLKDAEENNESVHILSHVPPGDPTCLQEWTRQYRRIVQRFANTITGHFNGHTHYDEFRVFFKNPQQVVNVAFNGGSFTSFSNLNPNYRFYDVDYDTHELLDYEEWIYDLGEAHKNPHVPPTWFKLYNFASVYNVNSLKPQDIQGLLQRMADNHTLLEAYQRYKVREAKPSLLRGCNKKCEEENVCAVKSTEADEAADCSDDFSLIPH